MKNVVGFLLAVCLCVGGVCFTACDKAEKNPLTSETTQSSDGVIELPEDKFD